MDDERKEAVTSPWNNGYIADVFQNGSKVSVVLKASLEIRKIIALRNKKVRQMSEEPITPKQRFVLRRVGINTTNMSKMQEIREISKIKQSGQVRCG